MADMEILDVTEVHNPTYNHTTILILVRYNNGKDTISSLTLESLIEDLQRWGDTVGGRRELLNPYMEGVRAWKGA